MKVSFSLGKKEILAAIRERNPKVMEEIYFGYRKEFVGWSKSKFGISANDALDHYQDTLTIFFEKVINGEINEIESTIKTYLFGIGKNRIRQQFNELGRREQHHEGLAEHYRFLANDKLAEVYEETRKETDKVFDLIGEGCKEILRLFYFEKKSMSEIADLMGHKSEGVSRTTKKRCLEKIRSHIDKNGDG